MTADEALTYDFTHIAVATGSHWRADGVGRWHTHPVPMHADLPVLTPDDLMDGIRPEGSRIVLFDDDHYYMGGVLAELLAGEGCDVVLVTPAPAVSQWTVNTLEQARIHKKLLAAGVHIELSTVLTATGAGLVTVADTFTSAERTIPADALVTVTARLPNDQLVTDLQERHPEWPAAGLESVTAIGDCLAPGTIAAAVWDGHRYAADLNEEIDRDVPPFRREVTALSGGGATSGE